MTVNIKHNLLLLGLLFVLFYCDSSQAQSQQEIKDFVNSVVEDLNKSSLQVPGYETAQAGAPKKIKETDGISYYLCTLKNEQGDSGYVAVACKEGLCQVVALSATNASPEYFLKELQIQDFSTRPLQFSKSNVISFAKDVPLVATTKTVLDNEPVEISEIASSLSSFLNYLQYERKILFFGHISFEADPEYIRRFKENPASTQYPDDPDWKSLEEETKEAIEREKIPEGQPRSSSNKIKRNVLKPIVRTRLLNPINARERLEVIKEENKALRKLTPNELSRGMEDAILLQLDLACPP